MVRGCCACGCHYVVTNDNTLHQILVVLRNSPKELNILCQSHLLIHLYMCIVSIILGFHVVTSVVMFIELGAVEGQFV